MKKFLMLLIALASPVGVFAGPVNVNTADAEMISQELIGIGMAKAQAIIEYRTLNGAFETPEELLKVKGIGPRVLAANTGNILVEDSGK
jgi:competence protein ComEA